MNGDGILIPPHSPPIYLSSIALSTNVSAVKPKHSSFQNWQSYILNLVILSNYSLDYFITIFWGFML